MTKYIDKDKVAARIKKLKMDIGNIFNEYDEGFWEGRASAFDDVICVLGNLETKGVDLQEEIDKELAEEWYGEYINLEKFKRTAKHFFELGRTFANVNKKLNK